jgi:hypothetical protein
VNSSVREGTDAPYPLLRERTAVRMDLTHCGWSDIFFLGMDYPEGARVLNISVDLGVHGRDAAPQPPIEAYFRVIDEPVIRLASVDLEASACLTNLDEVFDFGRDYLGPAQGCGDRFRVVIRPASNAPARISPTCSRDDARTRPGFRTGEQRQPDPEGFAACRLDQPARGADRRVHARHRARSPVSPAR